MPTGTIAPVGRHTFFTDAGAPAASHKVFTYLAGTTTKEPVYLDVNLTSAHPNPIILGGAGRATIFLVPGKSYKWVLAPPTDGDPPTSPLWTIDNMLAVPTSNKDIDIDGIAGEDLLERDIVYLSDGAGGRTAGRWYKADADNEYSSTLANAVGGMTAALLTGVTGSIRIQGRITGFTPILLAGVPYYISTTAGGLQAGAPTNARYACVADSTTSVIITHFVPGPNASLTVPGIVSLLAQSFIGVKTFALAPVFQQGVVIGTGQPTLFAFNFTRSAANVTVNNSTVFVNVTGLSFAIGANEAWTFMMILHTVSAVAAGLKFTITGPAAPTALRFGVVNSEPATTGSAAAFGTAVQCGGIGSDQVVLFSGLVRNGANAGTVQLQMAQLVADVSNTVVYAESSMVALRVT